MIRLGFSLIWLGFIWFGLFPCTKKICGGSNGMEKTVGKKT